MFPRAFSRLLTIRWGLIGFGVVLPWLLMSPYAGGAEVLQAGIGTKTIRSPPGARLNAFPLKQDELRIPRVAEGTRDPLTVKCLVLQEDETILALTACDLGSVPGTVVDRVRGLITARIPMPAANILIGATHTHQSLFLGGAFNVPPLAEVRESLAHTIAEAVVEAYRQREPARMGTGRGFIELNHNRRFITREETIRSIPKDLPKRRYYGPIDHEVGVIRIDDAEGMPLAVLVNYTAHPTIMRDKYRLFSAEYPGAMSRHVNANLEQNVEVLFFSGALGNIAPYQDRTDDWELMEEMGKALGDEVLRVYPTIQTSAQPGMTVKHREIPFGSRHRNEKQTASLHMIAFDDTGIVTVGGELFVQIGLEFKRRSLFPRAMVFGLVDGSVGYIPHGGAYQYGGYGVEMFTGEKDSRRTLVPEGFGEQILEAWLDMMYEAAE